MTNKIKRFTLYSSILLTAGVVLLVVLLYCKNIYDENIRVSLINNANRKALYLSFLVHKKNKELQEYLIDILQEDLIWMDKTSKSNHEYLTICDGWRDPLFKEAIKEKQNDKLKKILHQLDSICNK